jgi:hypothetical protein
LPAVLREAAQAAVERAAAAAEAVGEAAGEAVRAAPPVAADHHPRDSAR